MEILFFLLDDSFASEFYVPTFRNTLLIFRVLVNKKNPCILLVHTTYEDGTECSETSAHKIQTPGNRPNQRLLH